MQDLRIGQDFTTQFKMNLLPGIVLKRGIYQTNIQYQTEYNGLITMHNISQNMHGGTDAELTAIFGRDVRYIDFQIYCHNSFPTNPLVNYRYQLRIDHLILLNLAVKLLK